METPKKFLELVKKREKLAAEVQASADIMTQAFKKLLELDHDLFPQLQRPDCVFFESPIAPHTTENWFKQHLQKVNVHTWSRPRVMKEVTGSHKDEKGRVVYDFKEVKDSLQLMIKCFSFVGVALDGEASLKSFLDRAAETSKWILRFAKEEEEKKKTGLEEIL